MAKKKHHGHNISFGQIACETYHKTVGTGFNWGAMSALEQEAWAVAAEAVIEKSEQEATQAGEDEANATH
jgi:hypothetical protein